jgi:serine/threonine protein kinase
MHTLPQLNFPKDKAVSASAQDFIISCLNVDPSERPTVKEMISHPYLMEMKVRVCFD